MAKSSYHDHHRQDLRLYVLRNVELEEIKSWLLEKMSKAQSPTNKDLPKSKYGDKEMITELVKNLAENTSEDQVIWELAKSITRLVQVDAYRVYKLPPEQLNCALYFDVEAGYSSKLPQRLVRADDQQVRWLLQAAKNGSCLRLGREDSSQFPDTPHDLLSAFDISDEVANYLLYQPILTTTGNTSYVIEMWRLNVPFTEQDEETSANCTAWGTLALHFRNQNLKLARDRIMSDFLLEVVKALFEDMGSLDQLIKRILEYAQKLVNADRASLFLVDYRNFELVSTVFDLKFDPRQSLDVEKKEIRIPINRGIAGYVALSGEIMNIPDAYSDDRFNRDIDKATGYKTVSILCMPVKVKGRVIGVVQMVNKRTDKIFRREDEVAFQIFATFFGLALHHAKLYEKILRKEQKYRVALEVLSYHITCKENDVAEMLEGLDDFPINLEDFHLDSHKLSDIMKCKALIVMMDDLFDMTKFDLITVARFILTVKKNYRDVPYHNYDHGWSVAQCMYMILKNDDKNRYSYNMRLALFIACLCHDLDHRGLTNKYTNDTASPLAAMYTTSPLEHHHFNTAVTILQQEGHNIFAHFPTEDYKEILVMVRQNILATDLAAFFPNLSKMHKLLNRDSPDTKFDWAEPGHRDLAMAISMTAADLSAGTKPWKTHIKTVQEIFDEFYNQGDKEKAAGREPLPMMDREKAHLLPSCQVDFLTQICIPGFKVLYRLIPKTKPMLLMALTNFHLWKAKVVKMKQNLKGNTLDHIYEDEFVDFDAISKEILLEEVEAGVDTDPKTSNDDDKIVISKKEADKNVSPNEILKEVGEMVPSEDEEDVVMAKNRMHDLANNDFDVEYDEIA